MTEKTKDIALSVKNVKKSFRLPHEKSNSLKSSIVHIFNKQKGYTTQHALKNISFEVKRGEFFGIVGRNGSGKSTLLKILAETYQPSSGTVKHSGKIVPFIELGVGFNPELTGRENVYLNGALLGMSRAQIEAKYNEIVEFAELNDFMDQKLKNYSSGMQVRLAFSVATRGNDADILLIDEVLAVGDADFQRKCYDYFKGLRKTDTTIVFVTHDMNAVKSFCDRAILVEKGRIEAEGSPVLVADKYLQLFTGDGHPSAAIQSEKRWGNGEVKIQDLGLDVKNDSITINVALESFDKEVEDIVVGYNFKNSDGLMIMGGNSLNAKNGSRPFSLSAHSKKTLSFKLDNFLGSGEYSFEITVRDNSNNIFDKWENARSIRIAKAESYYPTIALATLEIHD